MSDTRRAPARRVLAQVVDTALKHGDVVRHLVRDPVPFERNRDLAGARIVDDVGAVGHVSKLWLATVHDVESRRPAEDVVALAAVELLCLPCRRAALE